MAFDEKLKLLVKKKSHQSCCICKAIGIKVHHIVSQANGGSNDFDNAAPLCPSCHEIYGANPTKQKFIKESRDIWYEICLKRYSDNAILLKQIDKKLESIDSKIDFESLKSSLANSITHNILQTLISTDKKFKKEKDLNLQEIINYLHIFKKPTIEDEKKAFKISYFLVLESKGKKSSNLENEFDEKREQFLKKFGLLTAEKLLLYNLKTFPLDWHKGVTEDQMSNMIGSYFYCMIFLLNHEDLEDAEVPLLIRVTKSGLLEARAKFPKIINLKSK